MTQMPIPVRSNTVFASRLCAMHKTVRLCNLCYILGTIGMSTKRIIGLITTLVVIALIGIFLRQIASPPKNHAACPRCNIVIITIDTLRASSLPCYGYSLNTAPNMCRFAKSNLLLEKAFANANWTMPSNFSIMTSLYPVSHGMVEPILYKMNPKVTTLAQRLASLGYMTSFVAEDEANIGIETDIARGFQRTHITPRTLSQDTMQTWSDAIDSVKNVNARHVPAFIYLHTSDLHDYVGDIFHPPSSFPLDPSYKPLNVTVDTTFTDDARYFAVDYLTDEIQRSSISSDINRYSAWREQLKNASSLEEAQITFDAMPSDMRSYVFMTLAKRNIRASVHYCNVWIKTEL